MPARQRPPQLPDVPEPALLGMAQLLHPCQPWGLAAAAVLVVLSEGWPWQAAVVALLLVGVQLHAELAWPPAAVAAVAAGQQEQELEGAAVL